MIHILDLLRIKDWVKNILVLFPLLFSENLNNPIYYFPLLITFLVFCFISSIIYILNDLRDIELDKLHPLKKDSKPLASGKISVINAFLMLVILLIISIMLITFNTKIINHIILYIAISLSYVFFLKKIPYLELFIISFGYLIRIDIGSVSININSSYFILLTTFFISFFFITSKRLSELNHKFDFKKLTTRDTLKLYSFKILDFFSLTSIILSFFCLTYFAIYKNIYFSPLILGFIIFIIRYRKFSLTTIKAEFPVNLIVKDKLLIFISLFTISYLIFIF
ncbi:UbiA family prenyltransferase [Alphaproteobacteria bacterium]|jgi:4-hydroxybenzoate polyprenyltransferase|nr:UbiA family prenyltransferase [Alphaproteobacteria bacterium]